MAPTCGPGGPLPAVALRGAAAILVVTAWFAVRSTAAVERARSHFLTPWAMRAFWLIVVTASLVALLGDISDVVEVTS